MASSANSSSPQPEVQENTAITENRAENINQITNEIILNELYTCEMCSERMQLKFYLKEHFEKCLENFLSKKPKNYVANSFLLFVKSNLTILPKNKMSEILEKVGYTWDDVYNATVVVVPPPEPQLRSEDIYRGEFLGDRLRNFFSEGSFILSASAFHSLQYSDNDDSLNSSISSVESDGHEIMIRTSLFDSDNESLRSIHTLRNSPEHGQSYSPVSSASSVSGQSSVQVLSSNDISMNENENDSSRSHESSPIPLFGSSDTNSIDTIFDEASHDSSIQDSDENQLTTTADSSSSTIFESNGTLQSSYDTETRSSSSPSLIDDDSDFFVDSSD